MYLHHGGERDYFNHRCKLKLSILEISLYPKSYWAPQKSNASHFSPAKPANFCANYNSSLWLPLEGLRAFYQYYWIKLHGSNLQSERVKTWEEEKFKKKYRTRQQSSRSWLFLPPLHPQHHPSSKNRRTKPTNPVIFPLCPVFRWRHSSPKYGKGPI